MKTNIKNLIVVAITFVMLASSVNNAQEFIVNKVSGNVLVLKGTAEDYENVTRGDVLNASDLLITEKNSSIQLSRDTGRFILNANSALGLNYIKEVSLNDLLLALTMEEVRSIPKNKSGGSKSTVVYGARETGRTSSAELENSLGIKKINGARQLAENGYKESAVIVAKETYRKYPSTKQLFSERLYFADLLKDLGLMREALAEYNDISLNEIEENQSNKLKSRIEEVSLAIANDE